METVPEVGLGAGASAAMADPMRAQTATRTSIRENLERAIAAILERCLKEEKGSFQLKDEDNVCVFLGIGLGKV
ncbi:hypothetical protein GQ457_12G031500 [Hibiscus cannabinus]